MLSSAIVLTHNKTPLGNAAQISNLLSLLTLSESREYYTINDLAIEHEATVFQIVPFGVNRPANMDRLVSRNVIYGAGDENKTSDHPRFFNWALKRAVDYGAQVILDMETPGAFDPQALALRLAQMADPDDPEVYRETAWGRILTRKLFVIVGLLQENLTRAGAITDLKARITAAGRTYG